ncbi:survival motor neuron protein-like [Cydia pomonella]|uniref:survival motor neuron protein-like n=1 Tax=Cydia pomonella TaxID=82600 RepID=UPI002ADD8DB0|nr:survival motor neuron protein-like [Cydia pomonella]XP_061728966.1 survival motor neuron protein-like [Cydia pomonella]
MSANKILFERSTRNASQSQQYEGVEANDWDDTSLNTAYDTAMKIAKAEVAKRVAMSTNTQPENRDDQKQSKKATKPKQPVASSSKMKKEWKAGMACRAVYEDDGLEYEAFVLRIVDDQHCVVRFLGYENCEMVPIESLTPSLGKNERQKQIEQAALEMEDYPNVEWRECESDRAMGKKQKEQASDQTNLEWRECESDRGMSPGSTEYSYGRKQKSPKKKKNQKANFELPDMPFSMPSMPSMQMRNMMANLGSLDMPLPPPPAALPAERADPEEQAVSSMLMSWYMSGYYTGLYQGMKRAKQGRKRV